MKMPVKQAFCRKNSKTAHYGGYPKTAGFLTTKP
jgi:hypothetical protein